MTGTADDLWPTPEDEEAQFRARADEAKRRWKERAVQLEWRRLLSNEAGRRLIWNMLDEVDTFRIQFRVAPSGNPDRAATQFYFGRSTWGFELYQRLCVLDHALVFLMHRENDPRYQPEPEETSQ